MNTQDDDKMTKEAWRMFRIMSECTMGFGVLA
jgi:hypothetical protein